MSMTAEVGTVYDVIAHREVSPEANFWVFEIPALGAVGQAVKLGQVTDEARGIITAWDEDGPDEKAFKVHVRLDGEADARRMWEEGEEEERQARKVLDHAATRKREAVTLLRVEKKYSANDTARVLGVTRQGFTNSPADAPLNTYQLLENHRFRTWLRMADPVDETVLPRSRGSSAGAGDKPD